jgi:hypothetical protein
MCFLAGVCRHEELVRHLLVSWGRRSLNDRLILSERRRLDHMYHFVIIDQNR